MALTPVKTLTPAAEAAIFLQLFFDQLARSGVEAICISPGSRSTPLTVAAHRTEGLSCTVHLDERSAGFFALGLARRTQRPVALICTSGTAATNYLPALAEAREARVPLIVLTADRPAELRDCGAGQTIDQLKLFGSQVKRFIEVAIGLGGEGQYRFARMLACRSVIEARAVPAGPVHLNWPLREPFDLTDYRSLPELEQGADELATGFEPGLSVRERGMPYVTFSQGAMMLTEEQLQWLLECVHAHTRGVIICGGLEPDALLCAAIVQLADTTGWPVLADPLSQLRCGEHIVSGPVLACSDWLLGNASFAAACLPEVVVQLGASPVSKAQRLWLDAHPPGLLLTVAAEVRWLHPDHPPSALLQVDPLHFCQQLNARLAAPRMSQWREQLLTADKAVAALLRDTLKNEPALLESRAVLDLAELLPEHSALYVSNSMPVRELDAFLPLRRAPLDVYANRGVNGIDGVLSSALGAAAGGCASGHSRHQRGPLTLLIGDLATLHDVGALLTAHQLSLNITIIVFNNDGGAIFSYLPIAAEGDRVGFNELFTVPHGLDFAAASELYGLSYHRVTSWTSYHEVVRLAQARSGTTLIELPIDAATSVRKRRLLSDRVAHQLVDMLPIDTLPDTLPIDTAVDD